MKKTGKKNLREFSEHFAEVLLLRIDEKMKVNLYRNNLIYKTHDSP